ncbi:MULTISPECIES: excisionase [Xenorhabdus]|uniref:Excisionase n=1 Tax=Xenorhabdus yunnanensis TaxID=3025878 RepID=A0ABT5LIH9_9GAMM|nr:MULTISPECIES: excisionase [Xenorhabdus]MDC9589679.1 excisionase [Xenorhabdus yunnanensis]
MARTQTLIEWAAHEFSEPIPSYQTLIRYAKNGMISPRPYKAGRCWRVEKSARFIGLIEKPPIKKDDDPRLMRILEDGSPT